MHYGDISCHLINDALEFYSLSLVRFFERFFCFRARKLLRTCKLLFLFWIASLRIGCLNLASTKPDFHEPFSILTFLQSCQSNGFFSPLHSRSRSRSLKFRRILRSIDDISTGSKLNCSWIRLKSWCIEYITLCTQHAETDREKNRRLEAYKIIEKTTSEMICFYSINVDEIILSQWHWFCQTKNCFRTYFNDLWWISKEWNFYRAFPLYFLQHTVNGVLENDSCNVLIMGAGTVQTKLFPRKASMIHTFHIK